jgi:hypothetical protein
VGCWATWARPHGGFSNAGLTPTGLTSYDPGVGTTTCHSPCWPQAGRQRTIPCCPPPQRSEGSEEA